MRRLTDFVLESNKIEGIKGASLTEIQAHDLLLKACPITIPDVISFVKIIQPNAKFRCFPDIPGVCVGSHIAPPSGPSIVNGLTDILNDINNLTKNPWATHVAYETLHPFTDGNGRSGRALWLAHMKLKADLMRALDLGFLHMFYYQTLANAQA